MLNTYSYLMPSIKNLTLEPKIVQLFIPPIKWKGDAVGHIGNNDALFFVASGECCIIIEEKSFIIKEGELAFLPKNKMRSYTTVHEESLTLYEVNFDAKIDGVYWYDALGFSGDAFVVNPKNKAEIKRLFEESVRYEHKKNILHEFNFCANILAVLREYIMERSESESLARPFDAVIDYMNENIDKQIRIEELAALVYMQPTYFIKKFKAAFGESPIVYLNKLRIYKSLYLLASTSLSLGEVAVKVGIYDSSYFSRMFKSYSGTTPSEYKNLFLKRKYSSK